MIIAFPIEKNEGLESTVFEHFGMAREYLIVDSKSNTLGSVVNQKLADKSHSCKSDRFSEDFKVDTVITLCIGNGSLRNLQNENIQVFKARPGTVEKNLELLKKSELKTFHMFDICRGERNKKEDGGCGHHH